jgi:hypothetical protein
VPLFTSILYPVIGEPPLFDGAFHERLICVGETGVATRPVGALGEVVVGWEGGGAEVVVGVAEASFEFGLAPKLK